MIAVLTGTRPEIIKMAPVIRELIRRRIPFHFIHSNQHYTKRMDKIILDSLKLPRPDFNFGVGSGTHSVQTGKILKTVEEYCLKNSPKILVVHGDTNTTLAGALAAKKIHVPVAHVEAGLRSHDYQMPEEINRTIVDRISDLLFAPTEIAKLNLKNEGITGKKVLITGNTIVDALQQHSVIAENSNILQSKRLKKNKYILATAHRAENVDDQVRLAELIDVIEYASLRLTLPVLWTMHPRTKKKLKTFNMSVPKSLKICAPVNYLDMVALIKNAALVMTDSGGIQEEAFLLHRPLVTMRDSTERPETLSANFLIHTSRILFDEALTAFENGSVEWTNQFGDGTASKKIVEALVKFIKN